MVATQNIIENEYKKLSQKTTNDAEENPIVVKKISDTLHHWSEIYTTVSNYQQQLTSVLPLEGNYHFSFMKLQPWLDDAEKHLEGIKKEAVQPNTSVDISNLVRNFQRDVIDHQPIYQDYNTSSSKLLNKCSEIDIKTDVAYIVDEVHHMNERWDKLRGGVDDVNRTAAHLKKALKDFDETCEPVNECIESMKVALDEEIPAGFDLDSLEFFRNELDSNVESMHENEQCLKEVEKKLEDVTSVIDKHGGDTSNVKKKYNSLNKEWKNTKDKITEKRDKCKRYLNQLAQFVNGVNELDNWVNGTTSAVTNLGPTSATPNGVKKQLDQIVNIMEEINKQKVKLSNIEDIADWLCDESKDNPGFCSNVKNKLNKVDQPLDQLRKLLVDRKSKLQSVLAEAQDFQVALNDISGELDKLFGKQENQKPVSVSWRILKLQNDEHAGIEKEIEALKPIHEKIISLGTKIIKDAKHSPETVELEERLTNLKKRFTESVQSALLRRSVIDKLTPNSEKFFNKEDDLSDWLDVVDKNVEEFLIPLSLEDVMKIDDIAINLAQDICKKLPEYEQLQSICKELFSEAAHEQVNRDVIETEKKLATVSERWKKINMKCVSQKDRIKKYKDLLTSVSIAIEQLKTTIDYFEKTLEVLPRHSVDANKADSALKRITEILHEINSHEPQLESLDLTGSELASLIDSEKGVSTSLKSQITGVKENFKKLKAYVQDQKNDLEKKSRVVHQFNTILQEVNDWCSVTSEEVGLFAPVSKEPEEAKKQIQKIDVSI